MEVNTPLISVIVPNYNHEKYLVQRLESIFNQTYSNFEVILLDDCSTDKSREILLKYAKNPKVSHYIFNEVNSGNTFLQWRKGINLAKGNFLWIAESDDFCDLNFLDTIVKSFLDNNQIVLSYCQSNKVDENNILTGNWISYTQSIDSKKVFLNNFVMEGNLFIEQFLINRNVIPNVSAVVFKKSAIKDDSYLTNDPEFRYCGDWILYTKLIANCKVAFTSGSLNNFRKHSKSVIANAVKSENQVRIIDLDLNMRKVLIQFLKKQSISSYNKIKTNNENIVKALKYEKAVFLINSSRRLEGYLLLLIVFDVFIKMNLRMRIRNILK